MNEQDIQQAETLAESLGGLLATPEAFVGWLMEQHQDEIIGHACMTGACPIAMFLLRSAPGRQLTEMRLEIQVTGYDVLISERNSPTLLKYHVPRWVTRFIQRVDMNNVRAMKSSDAFEILRWIT